MPINVNPTNFDFTVGAPPVTGPSYVGFKDAAVDSIQRSNAQEASAFRSVQNYPIVLPQPKMENVTNFLTNANSFATFNQANFSPPDATPQGMLEDFFNDNLQAYAQANNLTQKDVAALKFAFFNPDQASNLSLNDPNLKVSDVVTNLTEQTILQLQAKGIDTNNLKPDAAIFNLNISDFYTAAFEKAVKSDSALSDSEKGTLIYLLHNPKASLEGIPPKLLTLLENFKSVALTQTKSEFQLPANFVPQVNSAIYNGGMNASFGINLKVSLDNFASSKQLSFQQKQDLLFALTYPKDPSLKPETKAQASEVMNSAAKLTKEQYNLPVTFAPQAEQMPSIIAGTNNNPAANAFVQSLKLLETMKKNVDLFLPEGPEKDSTFNLLAIISASLAEIQVAIQSMQFAHSDTAKKVGAGNIEMQIHKNKLMAEQKKKADKAAKKQKALGILAKIFKPLMKIIQYLFLLFIPYVGPALIVLMNVYDFDPMKKAMEGIVTGVTKLVDLIMGQNGSEKVKAGLRVLFTIVAAPVMAATMSLIGTAPMDILAQFLSEGGILTNLGKSFGMSDTNTQYFVMAVTLTITIITVIATMILKPDKAATKTMEAAANFGNKASKAVESVGNSMKIFDSIGRSIVSALKKAKDLEKLEKIIEPMITSIEKATKVVTQALDRLIQFVQKTVEKSRLIRNIMEKISSEINRNFANGRGLMWIGVLQGLMGAYNGFTSAASSFIQADLVRTKARLDAQMAEIEAMMRVLKKTIQSIIDGLGDMGELRKELNMLHDSMLSNMSQLTKQLTSH